MLSESPTFLKPAEVPVTSQKSQHWNYEFTSEKEVCYSQTGPSSESVFKATTIPDLFAKAVELKGDKPALAVERPVLDLQKLPLKDGKPDIPPAMPLEEWKTWTMKDFHMDTRKVAKAFIALGLKPHESCNVFGFNSPEWIISMNAAIFAGGKIAGIYPTDTPGQIKYKNEYSNGRVFVVDGQKTFDKVKSIASEVDLLRGIVYWGDVTCNEIIKNKNGEDIKLLSWEDCLAMGEKENDDELDKRIKNQKPTQSCCIVFTSGTTGPPKGVLLSHDNVLWTAYAVSAYGTPGYGDTPQQERLMSYLPLSHVAALMLDFVCQVVVNARFKGWVTVHFARPYDLKAGSLVQRLQMIKPTTFLGVPRVWEKMSEKLKLVLGEATGIKASLARWSMRQGQAYIESLNFNHEKPNFSSMPSKGLFYMIADKLVLSKVRAKLGLDECKCCFSGAAPVQVETLKYMASFGININEAYGMSETAAGGTWSTNQLHLWGSTGFAFFGAETKVLRNVDGKNMSVPPAKNLFNASEEEQGEICFRGRNVMIGYLANPKLGQEHVELIKKKNAEAIDYEGFMHSQDKGAMSTGGFFKITGRYKDLIITAGGENIAPVPIENHMKMICPILSNFVMIGDKRKFNIALVTLQQEGATGELPGEENLVLPAYKYLNTESKTITEAMKDEKIIEEIKSKLKETNGNGEVVVSNACKIQKFVILPRDFSVSTEDLTPTLKLKRGYVTKKFKAVIDLVYSSSEIYVPFPADMFSNYYP